eukprot:GHRR01002433.1.p1 GENE.GHRR01002433.1~~GHRR01002433.1.p1  ORF type:complete len:242 (+),score=64.83 GHRR01002433.1:146-871(+)
MHMRECLPFGHATGMLRTWPVLPSCRLIAYTSCSAAHGLATPISVQARTGTRQLPTHRTTSRLAATSDGGNSADLANLQAFISAAPAALTNPAFVISLATPVVLGTLIGATGAFTGAYAWYKNLRKPWYSPPDSVFGIAWTALYLLMGLAAYRVYERTGFPSWALTVYLGQLGLNLLWYIIFFDAKKPRLAQVENIVFFLLVCYTTYLFALEDETAGLLMLPYVAWVAFANLLNFGIIKRN